MNCYPGLRIKRNRLAQPFFIVCGPAALLAYKPGTPHQFFVLRQAFFQLIFFCTQGFCLGRHSVSRRNKFLRMRCEEFMSTVAFSRENRKHAPRLFFKIAIGIGIEIVHQTRPVYLFSRRGAETQRIIRRAVSTLSSRSTAEDGLLHGRIEDIVSAPRFTGETFLNRHLDT